jgi:hypothetical protein
MFELFMRLMLERLELLLNFYSLGIFFFFEIGGLKFWQYFFCLHFS